MTTWKAANAVVWQVTCHQTLATEPRVRDDAGGWAW